MAWAEDEAMHRPHVGLEADYDEDQEDLFGDDDGPEEPHPDVDEAHVLLLTAANFTSVLAARRHVMVEFYAPWCGHCLALAPHYAAAAAASLAEQGIDVVLAKVDATEDHDLAQAHDVQGYPTLLFLIDDVPRDYSGERTKDAIMAWVGKKLGTAVENLTAVDEAEKVVTSDNVAMLAYLHYLSTRYIKDCKRLYGRILDSNSVKSSIQAKTKDRSEKVWTENRKPPATSPTRAPCAAEEGMAMSDMPDYVIVLLVERHPGCSKFNNLFMLRI